MKTNTHAFGSTFTFFANAQSHKKMQKSYQANAPRHDQMNDKKGEQLKHYDE